MRFDIDAEFAEDGTAIELISLGIAAEDGRILYLENAEFNVAPILDGSHPSADWLLENVWPHLSGGADAVPLADMAAAVVDFVGDEPEFWGWYADYDWVVLCQLFGRMVDLPAGWPMFCGDAKQLHVSLGSPVLPPHRMREHHAGDDALHQQAVRLFLQRRRPAALFYDPAWLRLLGEGLIEEIDATLDFEGRFLDVSAVTLAADARPRLAPGGPVVVVGLHGCEVLTPDGSLSPRGGQLVVPAAPLALEADIDLDDMIAWAWGAVRSEVVASCVTALEAGVRAAIAGLFEHTAAVSGRVRAEEAIVFEAGPGELLDMTLANGVAALYRPTDLVVAQSGPVRGALLLGGDKEHCVLRVRLDLCAGLAVRGGRRLHLEAPGPVAAGVR